MEHVLNWVHSSQLSNWDRSIVGYAASALVLTTFCMTSMLWLRATAIASNVAFISYAVMVDIRPVLILHSILLPVNVIRLSQLVFTREQGRRARVTVEATRKARIDVRGAEGHSTPAAATR